MRPTPRPGDSIKAQQPVSEAARQSRRTGQGYGRADGQPARVAVSGQPRSLRGATADDSVCQCYRRRTPNSQPTNQPTSRTKSKSSFTFRQPCMHHPHCMRAARSERHGWCWLLHCYAQRAETAAAQFVSGQRPSRPPPGTDRWRHSPRPNITSRHSPASRRAVVASAFSYRLGLRRATIRGGPSRSLGRRAA